MSSGKKTGRDSENQLRSASGGYYNPAALIEQLRTEREDLQNANEELRITEEELRAQTEELIASKLELEQTKQQYLELFNEAPDGYIVTDRDGFIRDANQAAASLLGQSVADLKQYPRYRISDFIPKAVSKGVLEPLFACVSESTSRREGQIFTLKGDPFWAAISVSASRDENGAITGLRWLIRDITDRKRAEEALREGEALLARELEDAKLLQSISVELLQKNDIGALYEKILGAAVRIMHSEYASLQMLCREHGNGGELRLLAFHGVDSKAAKNWEWVSTASARSTCSEALRTGRRVIMPDLDKCDFMGTEDRTWFSQNGIHSCQTTPLVSRSGKLVGMISTHWRELHIPSDHELSLFDILARQVADLMENEKAEETLRKTNAGLEQTVLKRTAQLSERAAQLRALAGEITVSEQRERQRLAQVLHDGLQQILVGAKYRLDFASRSQDMRSALAEISELIDDAINTSRSLTAELSPTVLLHGDLIRAMEWLAHWMHEKYELDVVVTARKKIDILAQDVILTLFQAVRELLFNVVKHAGVKTARILLHQLGGKILITVEDKGVGFDPNQLQANEAQSHGMGLFGISERISHMSGRLRIKSAPGQGSRFKLSIPYLPKKSQTEEPAAEPIHAPVTISSDPEAKQPMANQTRIILVDDHQVMRQGLAGLLRLEPGFDVVGEASDGETAIGLVRKLRPDVVLMDVSMPGMDGIDATRIIHQAHPEIRVIGLSMFNANEQATAMREAGAVNYITKSGPSEILIEAIRSCARVGN